MTCFDQFWCFYICPSEEAFKLVKMAGFITASEAAVQRANVIYLSTGSNELDKLLGGGMETVWLEDGCTMCS